MHISDPSFVRRFLHGTWHAMRQMERVLADAGDLDTTDLVVLEYASLSDLGPSAIAEALRLPPHAVSRALGRLDEAGLLDRGVATGDARRRTLVATKAGRDTLARLHAMLGAHVAALLADQPAERVRAFADVLTAVVASDGTTARAGTVSGPDAAPSAAHRGSAPRHR